MRLALLVLVAACSQAPPQTEPTRPPVADPASTGGVVEADAAPLAEGPRADDSSPPPVATAENRCAVDADCRIDDLQCGTCPRCPGPREAWNVVTYEQRTKECADRPRTKPACRHCPPPDGTEPNAASCDRGACVPVRR